MSEAILIFAAILQCGTIVFQLWLLDQTKKVLQETTNILQKYDD